MSGHRSERIGDRIRQVVADVLREEVRDPEVGFVTVTGVDLSPDLRNARVYVSILDENKDRSLRALARATPFLRHALANRAGLRFTPRLSFALDRSTETGFRIAELLDHERTAPDGEGDDGHRDDEDRG